MVHVGKKVDQSQLLAGHSAYICAKRATTSPNKKNCSADAAISCWGANRLETPPETIDVPEVLFISINVIPPCGVTAICTCCRLTVWFCNVIPFVGLWFGRW
eukprot:TRINITY_DN61264_c0_g2_i1.p1 TRINITY_DN61264_c0_g2~~TRINITY_DN61264_c0_g2_i1.p1  ORF type:complete len:102 (-),score=5.54 TRINITY_DN61264_c0_g2_i1:248-553(-)